MMRNFLALIIPVLWSSLASPATAAQDDLASLVSDWRQAPTPARQAAVESYAKAHAREVNGALAHLALGVGLYEQQDYPGAIAALKNVTGRLPAIADYPAYYLAAARVESQDFAGIPQELAPTHRAEMPSPLGAKSWLLAARALQNSDAPASVRLLREHYTELPQPDGDLLLADSYQAAKDLPHAVEFYQRVYSRYLTGEQADNAAAALTALRDTMGVSFPEPLPEQMLRRTDLMLEALQYPQAKAEYQGLVDKLVGASREKARVRIGAADGLGGNPTAAAAYLRGLDLSDPEADAERLYYLEEFARRLANDSEMSAAVEKLSALHPQSPWRLKAMVSAANRFLLGNRPDDYIPLYRAAYTDFPNDSGAGLYHWKVAFQSFLRDKPEAVNLLREHLQKFPKHATAGASLYFLARSFERSGDTAAARSCYDALVRVFRNSYYAVLTRDRLAQSPISNATGSAETEQFLTALLFNEPKPVPTDATAATTARIQRSRLLHSAGLNDLAVSELRFGARSDAQPQLMAMEIADQADAAYLGLRAMKAFAPEYLTLPLEKAPRKYWEYLFPLPFRADLNAAARTQNLDPFLVAGLIRQESEFNPDAVSRANALGLMQVRPGTGRQFARKAGFPRFTSRTLFQPGANLRIGTTVLRSMLDRHNGNLEETLAAYNAGPNRAAEWLTWNQYREPAEFVESIPITETRDYVQTVLRNADMYKRLYR
jgi:soluble lytic murein transglycosylase